MGKVLQVYFLLDLFLLLHNTFIWPLVNCNHSFYQCLKISEKKTRSVEGCFPILNLSPPSAGAARGTFLGALWASTAGAKPKPRNLGSKRRKQRWRDTNAHRTRTSFVWLLSSTSLLFKGKCMVDKKAYSISSTVIRIHMHLLVNLDVDENRSTSIPKGVTGRNRYGLKQALGQGISLSPSI